jgi:uncharacterized membrane protein YoaK (UPF0700 family)
MIAGYVDGFGLLTFNTYLSFMSGNTTQTACNIGQAAFLATVPTAVAIVFFLVGVIAGNMFGIANPRQSRPLSFAGIGLLLAGVAVGARFAWLSDTAKIAAASLSMGIMSTTVTRVGHEPVNFTFVTGTLSRFGRHIALAAMRVPLEDSQGPWDSQLGRAFQLIRVWAGFFGGAILAGVAAPRLGGWALLPPAIILLTIAAFARARRDPV